MLSRLVDGSCIPYDSDAALASLGMRPLVWQKMQLDVERAVGKT